MLPAFTEEGMLPPGVHAATLDEVIRWFGGGAAQRVAVTQRLEDVVRRAQGTGHLRRIFVWGSYVSAKLAPGDVDVFLVMGMNFQSEACTVEAQAVFDGERAEKELGATVLWMREDAPEELLQMFLDQWQTGRGGAHHGIVEVVL